MIDVRRLAILREVARLGSFNRAATELRLTPSAVSQAVAALERGIGAEVVRRSTRGVELTAAGRILTEAAEAISAEISYAEREIARLGSGRTDSLTVATFTSGGQRLLPAALTRLTAGRPAIDLTVLEQEPVDSLPQVRSGAADLALVYHFDGPPPSHPGVQWMPLMDDPMWLVLPAGHPRAGRESLTIAELAGERWVHGCLEIVAMVDHYAAMGGFEVRTACKATDYQFAQSLVRAGVGVAMIPQVALTADRGGLAMIPLAPPGPTRYIGVATAAGRPRELTTALIEALRESSMSAIPLPIGPAAKVPAVERTSA